MTTYKLKKQVADIMPGEKINRDKSVWYTDDNPKRDFSTAVSNFLEFLFNNFKDEWFEEIDNRWKPEIDECYWIFRYNCVVNDYHWDNNVLDRERHNFGNCFQTEEQAEQARVIIHKALLDFHKNNN